MWVLWVKGGGVGGEDFGREWFVGDVVCCGLCVVGGRCVW